VQIKEAFPYFDAMRELLGGCPNRIPVGLGNSGSQVDFGVLDPTLRAMPSQSETPISIGSSIGTPSDEGNDSEDEREDIRLTKHQADEDIKPTIGKINTHPKILTSVKIGVDKPKKSKKPKIEEQFAELAA
jgi:hypothetical protein